MPRFSGQEREIIKQKLLTEGERLFTIYGLKKVTVDDLAAAANISKGSFYAFYSSKEHLYIEINYRLQDKLFSEIREAIAENRHLNPKALTKEVIMRGLNGIAASPILSQFDLTVMDYLQRKLPVEIFENHVRSDSQIFEFLEGCGVRFSFSHSIIIKSLYSVIACLFQYKDDDDLGTVKNILVDGIVEQCVMEF